MATGNSVLAVIRASRPSFRNTFDKAAFAVHASFLATGYVLAATGPVAFSDDALSGISISDEVGIGSWNDVDDNYAFVYVSPDPDHHACKVHVKCIVMNDRLFVDGFAETCANLVHLGIEVPAYVTESQEANYATHYKNLDRLVKDLDAEIFSKLHGQHIVLPAVTKSSTRSMMFGQIFDCTDNKRTNGDLGSGPGAGMGNNRDGSMMLGKSVLALIRASRPTFRHIFDKAAFAVHASFLASGYVLAATGPVAFSDEALPSIPISYDVGIGSWNEHDNRYAFVYISPDPYDSCRVIAKCRVMNGKLLVDAVSERCANLVHVEFDVPAYVTESQEANYATHYKNLDRFVKTLDDEIFSKFVLPPVTKSTSSAEATRESRFTEDEEEPLPFRYTSGLRYLPEMGSSYSDLDAGPGAGMYPYRGNNRDGSMMLGPNDSRWFGFERGEPGFPVCPAYDPGFPGRPAGVPPGARFDPYGPPGVPGFEFEPNRILNRPPRRGQGGFHPDLQHFGGANDLD